MVAAAASLATVADAIGIAPGELQAAILARCQGDAHQNVWRRTRVNVE